jgi:GTP-binding protein
MVIRSADFKKGITGEDDIIFDGTPQVAFVGRSNVGKSSVINTLVAKKELARSSSRPGKTQEINFYLINKSFYLVDLPGYGFAEGSWSKRDALIKLIHWYLQNPDIDTQKVVLIIDAKVGPTENDLAMLALLEQAGRRIVVVANKIDKLKKAELQKSISHIQTAIGPHTLIPYSAEKKINVGLLTEEILKKPKQL